MIQIIEAQFNVAALLYPYFVWIGQERSQEDFISQQLYAQMMGWC